MRIEMEGVLETHCNTLATHLQHTTIHCHRLQSDPTLMTRMEFDKVSEAADEQNPTTCTQHIHTQTQTHTHYTRIHTHTYVYVYIHLNIFKRVWSSRQAEPHNLHTTHTHTYTHTYTHTHAHSYVYVCTHICIYIYIHRYFHMCTCVH